MNGKFRLLEITASVCVCTALLFSSCSDIEENTEPAKFEVIENQSGYGSMYVYETLSDKEKSCYDAFVRGVEEHQTEIKLPEMLNREEMRKIYVLVYNQEPQLFWLSSIFAPPLADTDVQTVSYRYSEEECAEMQTEIDNAVGRIMAQIPPKADTYEKLRTFHDWIVKNVSFEEGTYYSSTVYGALKDGKAQCEGYAFAFSYLCDIAGIPNIVVPGTNDEGSSHVWNKVCINGLWYNIDVTWDDPTIHYDNPDFIRHDYMLVSDSDIIGISHFPDESYYAHPECVSTELNYYTMEGLTADTADEAVRLFAEQAELTAQRGIKETEIRITDKNEYESALSRLFDDEYIKTIFAEVNASCGTDIKNAYKYNNDNLLIIHVSFIYK